MASVSFRLSIGSVLYNKHPCANAHIHGIVVKPSTDLLSARYQSVSSQSASEWDRVPFCVSFCQSQQCSQQ